MGQSRKLEGVGVDGRASRRRWNKGRRKRSVPYGVFVAVIFVGIVGLVSACAIGWSRLAQPYQHQAVQAAQISQLRQRLDADNASNTVLQRQIDSLKTQEGIEAAARSQRFVEPGEVLLNVQASASAPAAPTEDESFGARLKRAWDGLTGH